MRGHTKKSATTDEGLTNGSPSQVFTPQTPLAKRLWELRQGVLKSGVPLLSPEEIRQEVQARRGGVPGEEDA